MRLQSQLQHGILHELHPACDQSHRLRYCLLRWRSLCFFVSYRHGQKLPTTSTIARKGRRAHASTNRAHAFCVSPSPSGADACERPKRPTIPMPKAMRSAPTPAVMQQQAPTTSRGRAGKRIDRLCGALTQGPTRQQGKSGEAHTASRTPRRWSQLHITSGPKRVRNCGRKPPNNRIAPPRNPRNYSCQGPPWWCKICHHQSCDGSKPFPQGVQVVSPEAPNRSHAWLDPCPRKPF